MNILMIYVDALRPDHLGCYGYPKPTSPTIDRLAREGVRFERCVAVSTHTFPPIVSTLTGREPATHGMVTSKDYDEWVNKGQRVLPNPPLEVLVRNGYAVAGEFVNRWGPLGFQKEQNDFAAFISENRDRPWLYLASPYSTHMPYHPPEEYYRMFLDAGYSPDEETRRRLHIARTAMICHPPGTISAMEAGQPDVIGVPDEAHKRSVTVIEFVPEKDAPGIRALYDGAVRCFDDWLKATMARLEDAGVLDKTLVVLFADHGEELLERGHVGHSSCNLVGTLYDESLMVPLIMRCPACLPSGRVVPEQVSQIDIMPTVFDLLNLRMPEPVDGASAVPLILGRRTTFREEAYAEVPPAGWQQLWTDERRIWCVRTLRWKLIVHTGPPGAPRRCELYDLREDPGERRNLFDLKPEVARGLMEKLEAYMARSRDARTRTSVGCCDSRGR